MDLENWGLSERGGGLSYRKREINTRRFWNAYKPDTRRIDAR